MFDKCHRDKKSAILFSDPAKYTARTSNSRIAAIKHNSLKQFCKKEFLDFPVFITVTDVLLSHTIRILFPLKYSAQMFRHTIIDNNSRQLMCNLASKINSGNIV